MINKDDCLPIRAEDARAKTDKFLTDKNEKQLREIFQKIRMRIVEGEYHLDFTEPVAFCNEQILKEYGYKITYPFRSPVVPISFYTRIDWSGFEPYKGCGGNIKNEREL